MQIKKTKQKVQNSKIQFSQLFRKEKQKNKKSNATS